MPTWAFNPLLEPVGVVAVGQHLGIVVALQEYRIQRADYRWQITKDMAQVGEDSQAVFAVIHDENHTVHTVVRGRDGLDHDFAESQGFTGDEVVEIANLPESMSACRPVRLGRDVDREPNFR